MHIELTPDEAALVGNLLSTPVTIAPAQMPGYLALVEGLTAKLHPEAKGE